MKEHDPRRWYTAHVREMSIEFLQGWVRSTDNLSFQTYCMMGV
jgi:hypothetical protein